MNTQKINIQKQYLCFTFYDLYCINTVSLLTFNFRGCEMEYSTYYEISKVIQLNKQSLEIYTNKTGILCKQSKIEDRIRWKIFRSQKLYRFIQVLDNIIILQHTKAIWFAYNREYITSVLKYFCFYFEQLPKEIIKQNIQTLHLAQLNTEALNIIIQFAFDNTQMQIEAINTQQYKYSISKYKLGINFILAKSKLGARKYSKNTYAIKIKCNETNYNKILLNLNNKNIILRYTQNIKFNILIITYISQKRELGNIMLGYNSVLNHYKEVKICTVLI